MKTLLVCEYREGKLLESSYELLSFADQLGGEKITFLVGDEAAATQLNGKVYLADVATCGEYNPAVHKAAILAVVEKEQPDYIVFSHSSYGWDLAPRVTAALKVGQVTEVVGIVDDGFEVGCCNAKMRRRVKPSTAQAVVTVQAGAFSAEPGTGSAAIEKLEVEIDGQGISFEGYEPAEEKDVDLSKAEVIVTAGRGVGKKDNIPVIAALAKILGGELGASRPVVDAEWVAHSHQVGTTGQTVSPKLYVACGVSGAIQHLAGMKKSDFVVAINKDKDAPIGEVADVLVVADVLQFVPALTAKLQG